jgi:two-component system LytT family response regulator
MTDASLDGIRVLVVDDEAPARQRLMDLLRTHEHVKAVLEANDGLAAVTLIECERPDVVFLDVQMPELNGLGVIDAIGPAQMPLTVFVTAYDQHAIHAFESNALDYLLKPFSDERFEATLARARSRLNERQAGEIGQRILHMVSATLPAKRFLDRVVLKSADAMHFIRVADIDWVEGAGVYVNLHVSGKSLLYRAALNQLAENLDPAKFVRVHRSAIVNIDSIVRLEPISHGEFHIVLKNGGCARLSRSYRGALQRLLGQTL